MEVDLDCGQFADFIAKEEVTLLDVRTPEEYAEGHLPDAKLLDIHAPNFVDEMERLPKSGRYAIYCRAGHRSKTALEIANKVGITNVVHLAPGIVQWIAEDREIEYV